MTPSAAADVSDGVPVCDLFDISDGVPEAIGAGCDDYPMWQHRERFERADTIPMTRDDIDTKPARKATK